VLSWWPRSAYLPYFSHRAADAGAKACSSPIFGSRFRWLVGDHHITVLADWIQVFEATHGHAGNVGRPGWSGRGREMASGVFLQSEVVEVLRGLWCRDCTMSSAVRLFYTRELGPAMSLIQFDRCTECGGDEVDPPEG
jgi:hypothetical protein